MLMLPDWQALQNNLMQPPNNLNGFSLQEEHFKAMKSLKKKSDIIITRPDKGKCVVLLQKMMDILKDNSKFTGLGPFADHDSTARVERSLQETLRDLAKKGEIPDEVYKWTKPAGSIRPRMYGIPKVHKEGIAVRPILSMIGSPQHATVKRLAEILEPVSSKFSKYVLKDSFEFNDAIQNCSMPETGHICSFDIKSLFTKVPLEETVRIAANELYHSDLPPPCLKESSFIKLMHKVTAGIEFSFNEVMYRQTDGVAWAHHWAQC